MKRKSNLDDDYLFLCVQFFETIETAYAHIDEERALQQQSTADEGGGGGGGGGPEDVPMILIHQGEYRGEYLVIDCNIILLGAAPGSRVAENVIIERETESTVMFGDGAKNAYLGYVSIKVSKQKV